MEKLGVIFVTFFASAGLIFLALLTFPFIGYVAGSLFGWVFSDTWAAFQLWLQIPHNISAGQFFAFVAAVGGFFHAKQSGKDGK